jgi:RNase P protein component
LKKYTLNSKERIKHRKIIEEIFSNGETVYSGNIRINYIVTNFTDDNPAKAGFSVPKKKI